MDRVGNYGIYQNSYYDRTRSSKESGTSKASNSNASKKTEKKGQTTLSDSAKKLLKELQKTYGNMDFIVADYETDEEAASYLSRGTNQYSVLLTPDELEKMAADENVKKQNLKVLDDAVSKLNEMRTQLGEKGQEVSRLGITISSDGEVSFFAELEKVSEKQRERIEERRESRREEARQAEKKAREDKALDEFRGSGSVKRTTVSASSVEELLEKINQVNWDEISENYTPSGNRFNFTV